MSSIKNTNVQREVGAIFCLFAVYDDIKRSIYHVVAGIMNRCVALVGEEKHSITKMTDEKKMD